MNGSFIISAGMKMLFVDDIKNNAFPFGVLFSAHSVHEIDHSCCGKL